MQIRVQRERFDLVYSMLRRVGVVARSSAEPFLEASDPQRIQILVTSVRTSV